MDCKDGRREGDQSAAHEPETSLGRDAAAAVSEPLADEGKSLTEDCVEQPRQDSGNSTAGTGSAGNNPDQQHCDFLSTDGSEQQENDIPPAAGDALGPRGETAPDIPCEESNQQAGPGLVAQPEKVKKSKLEKLRELGIDLSIKPRISSGNESFINLDESDSNRGIALRTVSLSYLPE